MTSSWASPRMVGSWSPVWREPVSTACLTCSISWRYSGTPEDGLRRNSVIFGCVLVNYYNTHTFGDCQWRGAKQMPRGGRIIRNSTRHFYIVIGCRLFRATQFADAIGRYRRQASHTGGIGCATRNDPDFDAPVFGVLVGFLHGLASL